MIRFKRLAPLYIFGILIVSGVAFSVTSGPVLGQDEVEIVATIHPVSQSSEIARSGQWRYVMDVYVSGLSPQSSKYMLSIYPYVGGNPTSVLKLANVSDGEQLQGNEGLASGWNGQELERLYRALREQNVEPIPNWNPEGVTYYRSPASKFRVQFGVVVDDGDPLVRPDTIKVVAIYTEPGFGGSRWEKVVPVAVDKN